MPSEVSRFVGRAGELARLTTLLAEVRLATLVGPGGTGKTRLALRLATDVQDHFADGTWLVDLSAISDPALVPQALGDVIGIRQQAGRSWSESLVRALRARALLVVLDNCEHLTVACSSLTESLLLGCPDVRVLATSVQPLGAAGETLWRVPPLSLPPVAVEAADDLRESDAVALFVARVRDRLPDFALNALNAAVVAEICRRLDGLPLALELTAARVDGLGLAEVAARVNDRFRLAVGGGASAPARQRTLQAALEWTCGLLEEPERRVLRRVGVFAGGWTLAAAQVICADEDLDAPAVGESLERLVAKSLVVADHQALGVRYRLLETVRAWALDQLLAAHELGSVQQRHAEHVLELAERTEPLSLAGADAIKLGNEQDNIRAALDWALEREQSELGLRLASATYPLWAYSGHFAEGRAWFARLLALPAGAVATLARAHALSSDAQLLLQGSDFARARAQAQAALELFELAYDERGIGFALQVLGNVALLTGDLALASALHSRAAQCLRAAHSSGLVLSLVQLGLIAYELGDATGAQALILDFEATGAGDPYTTATAAYERGLVAVLEGDLTTAAARMEDAMAQVRAMGYQQGIVVGQTSLGHTYLDQLRSAAGLAAFAEVMRLTLSSGDRLRLVRALDGIARGLALSDPDAAVRLAAAVSRQRQVLGAAALPRERQTLKRWLADAERRLGPTGYRRAWEDGQVSTVDQAVSLAEALLLARSPTPPNGQLSPREEEVANLLIKGLTNRQIAAELVVSPGTVRAHVEHILAKLDLTSRTQVAVWASRRAAASTGGN